MTDPTAHPDDDALIGHLAAGEPAGSGVGRHLASCRACAETAALLALVRDTVVDDARHPVPATAVARAQALFRGTERGVAAPLAALRRIAADLVFDSWGRLAPGFAGVRGGGETRHLVWQAGEFDIDLQVQPADAGYGRLLGQVSSPDGEPALACVLSDRTGAAVATVGLDEFGAFALDAPAGEFDLLLETTDAILVLPGIQVG